MDRRHTMRKQLASTSAAADRRRRDAPPPADDSDESDAAARPAAVAPSAVEDLEFATFVRIAAESAPDVDALNARLAGLEMRSLRALMARVDAYMVRPLRIADPVRHLDNAIGFVLTSMGRQDLADGLTRVSRLVPYSVVVGYMRAYLVNAHAHCYRGHVRDLRRIGRSPPPGVTMCDHQFRRHMQLSGAPCAHLLDNTSSRWLNRLDKRRVRGAVRHIFAGWDEPGTGLEMFLVYDQYERLARDGVIRLAPGGQRFAHASVPADPAHPHHALLRAFVRTEYEKTYLDRMMRSLRRCFVPALIEALAAAYALRGGGPAALTVNTVVEAVRELDVPWFAEGTETPEPADMYYAHHGFHPVV